MLGSSALFQVPLGMRCGLLSIKQCPFLCVFHCGFYKDYLRTLKLCFVSAFTNMVVKNVNFLAVLWLKCTKDRIELLPDLISQWILPHNLMEIHVMRVAACAKHISERCKAVNMSVNKHLYTARRSLSFRYPDNSSLAVPWGSPLQLTENKSLLCQIM